MPPIHKHMRRAHLKTKMVEKTTVIDKSTGEVLEEKTIKHTYLANSKEGFFFFYDSFITVLQQFSAAEIRLYTYLLENIPISRVFVINDFIRKEITKKTSLSAGAINNTLNLLTAANKDRCPLIHRLAKGTYQLNPRYVYKGSSLNRNVALKAIIESGCSRC